mgnify:CR=1 FL=1
MIFKEITPEQAPESIAKEHLAESPKYYKELERVEAEKPLKPEEVEAIEEDFING